MAEAAEVLSELKESHEILGTHRGRIGRHHGQNRLYRHRELIHQLTEVVVRVGISRRVPVDLSPCVIVICPTREVVAVRERRESALERQDPESVLRQLEVSDDLGPKQAHHVGAHRVLEPGIDLLGDCGATEDVPPFKDQNLLPRPGEIGRGHQPVVTTPDDDRVVSAHAHLATSGVLRLRSGLKKGVSTTRTLAFFLWCSTVTSMLRSVPALAYLD